jgi:SulP family sulfate permease
MNHQEPSTDGWHSPAAIWRNIVVGLAVSFVALSLGAAFGILSGRGAAAGMISAGIISLITALFGGTRVQCSGPTAPMSVVAATVVAMAFDRLPDLVPGADPNQFINLVMLLTAVLLILIGLLRLGRYITLVPNVVISGFMNGIALLVWASQLRKLFGGAEAQAFSGPVWANVGVALATLGLVVLLPALVGRLPERLRPFAPPATLVALVLMTAGVQILGLPIGTTDVSGGLASWDELSSLVSTQWPRDWSSPLLMTALPFAAQLAALCYLDTLLTSLVIDRMSGEPTRQNQELIAQGAANGAIAIVGGIPGAQATIRSVLVIKEGGTMRLAGVAIGVFVLVEMVLLRDLIAMIPQAVFAGILFKVGYDVFDLEPVIGYACRFTECRNRARGAIFVAHLEMPFIVGTTLVTFLWDLNIAVIVFTCAFYLINKVLRPHNPIRDLKPFQGLARED